MQQSTKSTIQPIHQEIDGQEFNPTEISGRQSIGNALIPLEVEQKQQPTNAKVDKNVWMQARVVLIVTSLLFYFGFNRAMVASIISSETKDEFEQLFNFTGDALTTKAILSVIAPMGALCGTIACSIFLKYYSPKQIIFVASMFALIFTIVTMYTQIIILIIFRFFIGWTAGTFVAVIPSFIREITSKNVAPYFGTAPVINQSLGGLISFSVGLLLYEVTGAVRETWIIMCCINIVPLIIVLICLKSDFIYESPFYLLKTGNRFKAEQIYQQLYEHNEVQKIMKEKQLQIQRFYFKQTKMILSRNQNKILKRKDIIIAIHLPILRKMSGILIIILSSGSTISSIGPQFERIAPIFTNLIYFISCFLSNLLIKYLPRRAIFQLGTASICVCNLMIAISYFNEFDPILILVLKAFVIIMYGLTLGPVVWPYLTEVVPVRIIPLAQSMNWLIDCLTLSLPGVIIAHKGNPWPLFVTFILWDFFSIFINQVVIIQTKNKALLEIYASIDKR